MSRTNSLFLLVAAAIWLISNAHAQIPVPETRTVNIKVKFADLDLDKPADARILFSRLEKAAKRGCGPVSLSPSRYDLTPTAFDHDYKVCVTRAIGDVVARLNAPLVSLVYDESRARMHNGVVKR
jgi:UrcA family protein